nr:WYL domain-containing protein [Rhodococcus sp. (in: high G+C Gram-positive bacteria)]
MRADRLVATLLLMQTRGRVTAAEIAEELEISIATARRDLEALSAAGIPVYPQMGRGGGWQLVGGARTDLTGLTSIEAQALFTLVGPAAALTPDAKAALRKLVKALPAPFRDEAQAAAEATTIDPARWGHTPTDRPDEVISLQRAVVGRVEVTFGYAGKGERRVGPLGLVDKNGYWYLIAATARGQRTYRVDRMTDIALTNNAFVRPADFDLAAAWASVVDSVEGKQRRCSATVEIPERLLSVLENQFGQHCVVESVTDGKLRATVSAPAPVMIAQHLAGWGNILDVVDSDSVRDELARIGAELVESYGHIRA